jgi:hypothetical protein
MESQMTKHEPGLWAELNEYVSDIRSSLKLDSLAMACETESLVTVDEPPYSEEAHMQI